MNATTITVLLLITASYAAEVVNVAPGIFSKKVVCNELNLTASNTTFSPVDVLTTTVHLTKPHSVFVHYQFTFGTPNQDFYSKLLVNDNNAGSLVHSGKQTHKTATGFWMANLNDGYYTFEVHYKSPIAIHTPVSTNWQTAVLQVMWFEDARVVSDGIKCYPTSTATNNYNNWGPINDLQVILQLPNNRTILSAYQLSTEMSSASHLVTALDVNGFYQQSTSNIKGNSIFLDLHGAWAANYSRGIHYFNILYRTPTTFSFTDCKYDYKDNKNLYAMMLPPSCKVVLVNPRTSIEFNKIQWNEYLETDLIYNLTLYQGSHVIIMYQFAGKTADDSDDYYFKTRLTIRSAQKRHTASHPGYTVYASNFGLWQGYLSAATHKIALQYSANRLTKSTPTELWQTRALTIIYC